MGMHPLTLFCILAGAFTILMAASALSLKGAKTVYQMTDRLSWIGGGLLAIGVGFWYPWFTSHWWKALIFAPLLCIVFGGLAQTFLGSVLTMDTSDKTRIASRLIALAIVATIVVFALRACR